MRPVWYSSAGSTGAGFAGSEVLGGSEEQPASNPNASIPIRTFFMMTAV